MSTRDGPSLSEQEQAILASLAAKAQADDPRLAATLSGRERLRRVTGGHLVLPELPPWAADWRAGLLAAMVGLALMLVSLSSGLLVGVPGVLIGVLGVYRVAVSAPWVPGRRPSEPASPSRLEDPPTV
jgi:hypothetical protein